MKTSFLEIYPVLIAAKIELFLWLLLSINIQCLTSLLEYTQYGGPFVPNASYGNAIPDIFKHRNGVNTEKNDQSF